MNKQLTILIEGVNRSGKTLITSIIEDALKEKGISVTVNDQDGPNSYMRFKHDLKHNTNASDEMYLNEFCENIGVTINQKHIPHPIKCTCDKK
jgi:thymidylate kinase